MTRSFRPGYVVQYRSVYHGRVALGLPLASHGRWRQQLALDDAPAAPAASIGRQLPRRSAFRL